MNEFYGDLVVFILSTIHNLYYKPNVLLHKTTGLTRIDEGFKNEERTNAVHIFTGKDL